MGVLAAAAVLAPACGGEDGSSGSRRAEASLFSPRRSPVAQQHANAGRPSEQTYRGTLTIDVAYYGYDCQLRDLDLHEYGRRTYEMPVQVIRNAPAVAEDVEESSPFNLVVSGDPGNEAGITIVSATVAPDARDGKPILFEYWRITADGSDLEGELVQSWRRAGLAANVFPTDRLIVPCRPDLGILPRTIQTIDEGARLTGTIDDEHAELTVEGQTFDHERRFTARVTATRS